MPTRQPTVNLRQLESDRETLAKQLGELDAALAVLRRYGARPTKVSPESTPAPRIVKPLTAKQRAAISARMRRYWADRRKADKR